MNGPAVRGLQIADEPAGWRTLGFDVDIAGRCVVGAVALELHGAGGGIVGWELNGPPGVARVDGVATTWSEEPLPPPAAHPNGALTVDHVVLLSPDPDRTRSALEDTGMLMRRERDAGSGRRQLFFRHGETIVELVGPAGGETRLWGLTVTVASLDATAALLGDRLGAVRDAVQAGRRIATVHDRSLSVPLALMSA